MDMNVVVTSTKSDLFPALKLSFDCSTLAQNKSLVGKSVPLIV